MRHLRVITPPAAAVTAAEAKAARVFAADDADAFVDLLLAAAQGQIDGPNGWLGRAIGAQTIEMTFDRERCCPLISIALPLPPVNSIVSIKYDDGAGAEQTLDPSDYDLIGEAVAPARGCWPWSHIHPFRGGPRIRYAAGWATADVPAAIKHAIMLMAAELRTVGQAGGIVRREQVDGVGTFDYSVPDVMAKQLTTTAERLLAGYRVYRV